MESRAVRPESTLEVGCGDRRSLCELYRDLNATGLISESGILFMEGEGEPAAIKTLKDDLERASGSRPPARSPPCAKGHELTPHETSEAWVREAGGDDALLQDGGAPWPQRLAASGRPGA